MRELEYNASTPLSHRKKYGQFFTPPAVARMMAKWVIQERPRTILDPAFGLGIFYEAVKAVATNDHFSFVGYEIDKHLLDVLALPPQSNLRVIHGDYLESEIEYYDAIICNPPYMRFQKFLTRHNVMPKLEKQIGIRFSGYSNIASIFLIKALHELKMNGRLAFIMPYEFFNTGYGTEIKRKLLEKGLLKQIVIFSHEKEIFPDAITTVCVILCRKDGKPEAVKITHIESAGELDKLDYIGDHFQALIHPNNLPPDKKWMQIIGSRLYNNEEIPNGFCPLSFYGKVMRGIATGANKFFALSRTKADSLGIGQDNLSKCITKSNQITGLVFTEDNFRELVRLDKPVFCLNVKDANDESVRAYISYGERKGYNNRYLTKNRHPWFKVEHRRPAPLLFGVFSRGRLKIVRNYSSAVNFTCYHSFYPNMFGTAVLDRLFVYLISDFGQRIIQLNKRIYGDNLDKYEPRDLNEARCPTIELLYLITEAEANNVIKIAKENTSFAIEMSNELIKRIFDPQPRKYKVKYGNRLYLIDSAPSQPSTE